MGENSWWTILWPCGKLGDCIVSAVLILLCEHTHTHTQTPINALLPRLLLEWAKISIYKMADIQNFIRLCQLYQKFIRKTLTGLNQEEETGGGDQFLIWRSCRRSSSGSSLNSWERILLSVTWCHLFSQRTVKVNRRRRPLWKSSRTSLMLRRWHCWAC